MPLNPKLQEKYQDLRRIIEHYNSVGIAFSGGADSTLLVKIAMDVLGEEKVTAYHIVTDFNDEKLAGQVEALFDTLKLSKSSLKFVQLYPFTWNEIINNCSERCYFCKRRMYRQLHEEIIGDSHQVLLDGTNTDDLKERRPGLKAIRELLVKTPFLDARISKKEVRLLGRHLGVPNYDLPSNSCLATRIESGKAITRDELDKISAAEKFLYEQGFTGCRVKPRGNTVIVELRNQDICDFVEHSNRLLTQHKFTQFGLGRVLLDVSGRG